MNVITDSMTTLNFCHEKMVWTDLYSYVETQTARSSDNASRIVTTKIVWYVCHHHDRAMHATTMTAPCMSPPCLYHACHHHDCTTYVTTMIECHNSSQSPDYDSSSKITTLLQYFICINNMLTKKFQMLYWNIRRY